MSLRCTKRVSFLILQPQIVIASRVYLSSDEDSVSWISSSRDETLRTCPASASAMDASNDFLNSSLMVSFFLSEQIFVCSRIGQE